MFSNSAHSLCRYHQPILVFHKVESLRTRIGSATDARAARNKPLAMNAGIGYLLSWLRPVLARQIFYV